MIPCSRHNIAVRPPDKSAYWKIIFLFLNQNICCGYSKELSRWDSSFEHPKHMFKLMGKEINAIFGAQTILNLIVGLGAQWLSGRVLDSRPKGNGLKPYQRHCVVSLSKNINPSLVLVQPRKTCPFITERLLMGRKESNQTYKMIVGLYITG